MRYGQRRRSTRRQPGRRDRRGFALIAVLWALAGVTTIALSLALAARTSTGAAHNRTLALRAGWRAEGCVSVVRARIDSMLSANHQPDRGWLTLDSVLQAAGLPDGCLVRMQPTGVAVELNEIDEPWLLTVTSPSSRDGSWGPTIDLRLVRHEARAAVTRRRIQ